LNQSKNNILTEKGKIGPCIYDYQAGHTDCGCGGKERIYKRNRSGNSRCRQQKQKCADTDGQQVTGQ